MRAPQNWYLENEVLVQIGGVEVELEGLPDEAAVGRVLVHPRNLGRLT